VFGDGRPAMTGCLWGMARVLAAVFLPWNMSGIRGDGKRVVCLAGGDDFCAEEVNESRFLDAQGKMSVNFVNLR